MKSVILNKEKLTGFNVNATAPVGAIIMWASDNLPVGWLKCDHTELLIADYPKLYDRLKDIPQCQSENEGYFYTPDFRETVIVGAGENTTNEITAHDVYTLGQFKDDQLQEHSHEYIPSLGTSRENKSKGRIYALDSGGNPGGPYIADNSQTEYIIGKSSEYETNGTPRTGTTTHGKQTALHFIIKATQTSDSLDAIIDDSKTDIGHTWSGKKISEEIENSNTYSTEEKVVGTWIDGKPIYRKCINISNVASDYEHDVSSLNIDILCDIGGSFKDSSYKVVVGNYYVSGYRNIGCYYVNSSKKLRFQIQDLSSTNSVVLILEYTKTTD